MGMMAMALALIVLTVAAGYLLWTLRLHFEEIRTAAEDEIPHPRKAALLYLTLAGLIIVGTLAALLVEVQQLFTAKSS